MVNRLDVCVCVCVGVRERESRKALIDVTIEDEAYQSKLFPFFV